MAEEESKTESVSSCGRPMTPIWDVTELTRGGREALIDHEGQIYRLRITANRKLILTK